MKILTSLGLLLLVMTKLFADEPVIIHVGAGDKTFQVVLPSNPTTGYQWTVKSYDTQLMKLLSSVYTPSKNNLMGAGGMMVFRFERLNQDSVLKQSLLEFRYARPWEKGTGSSKVVTVIFLEY